VIDKLWFERSFVGLICYPFLYPLSKLYRFISLRRKSAYITGEKSCYRSPVPVIVVGNITAGGNGKTPVVIWLVEMLKNRGYRPGVISRGYGGKSDSYPLLVSNHTIAFECGDEPKLISVRTGVPVVVSPIRKDAVKRILETEVDIIISDDGLQHYALERDIEFIVVDGKRRFGNQQFIPLGPLRESLARLHTVDFVINNGGETRQNEIAMTLLPGSAVNLVTGRRADVKELKQMMAFAGIGNPKRFFLTLDDLGADIVQAVSFSDHRVYTKKELIPFLNYDGHVIMTEKDAVKCRDFANDHWWYLPVSADFCFNDEARIIKRIEEVVN